MHTSMYLVLVSHLASGPHLFHHKVPEFSLCFQVGLEHLRPAGGVDAKGRGTNKEKGSWGYFHRLHRDRRGIYWNNSAGLWILQKKGLKTLDLYVSELCDFQEAWLSLGKQEQTFLCHSNFTDATGGLDTRRQLVDTLIIVKMVYDFRGQVDVLCLSFCLLPESVEDSEEFRVHLLCLAWDRRRAMSYQWGKHTQDHWHIEGKNTHTWMLKICI